MSFTAQNTYLRMYTYLKTNDGQIYQNTEWGPYFYTCHGTKCTDHKKKEGEKLCYECHYQVNRYRKVFKIRDRWGNQIPRPGVSIDDELWARKMEASCWKIPDASHEYLIRDMQSWYDSLNSDGRQLNYWDLVYFVGRI
jgi:hypothetical protein